MSKSLGNVLDPFEVIDALRHRRAALLPAARRHLRRRTARCRSRPFERRYETELANELGNLASRTLAMVARYRDGARPERRARPGARRPTSTASPSASPSCIDRAELTPALDEIWQRVRRLNRYVEEQAPWQLAKDDARAADLDRVLRTLAEGLRVVTVLLSPWIPGAAEKLLDALGAPDLALARRRFGARRDRRGRRARAAVPASTAVIDSHTHLDSCEPPNAELVAAAARGGRHPHPHRRDGRGARSRERPGGRRGLPAGATPPSAATPTTPRASTTPTSPTSQALAAHPRCAAIGETGLDYFRDYAPRADQERAFHAQIELARATGKPLVIHTRAAEDDTLATLKRARRRARGRHALLLDARPPGRVPRRGLVDLVRRQRDLPEGDRPGARRPSACPTTACWSRPTRRTSRRRPCARSATSPPSSRTRRASSPSAAASPTRSSSALVDAQRRRALRVVTGRPPHPAEPAPPAPVRRAPQARPRPELPHRLEHPRRHRARRGARRRDDVVLEIGGGLGVLSEHLAARARARPRRRARPRARARAARTRSRPIRTRRCTSPTRSTSTSARSRPAPTKVVANLPYGIAASAILRTIEELDGVTRWVAMVQREVGERFAAAPGTPAYGVPSVLAQLACDVRVHRSIARTVFHPVPNVDSVLVVLRAHRPGARARGCARLVRAAFAHRRKALARSLALAPARARTSASAPARRCCSSAIRPTSAPSGSRPRSSARSRRRSHPPAAAEGRAASRRGTRSHDRAARLGAGEDQPLPLRRARRARTAATSS